MLRLLCLLLLAGCAFGGEAPDGGGRADASRRDAGRQDVGIRDAGRTDTGLGDAGVDAGFDAGPPTGPRVQVGTGTTMFEPVTEGQVLPLHSGPQGGGRFDGFHIWFGARTYELERIGMTVTFELLDAADRSVLGGLTWQTNFRALPDEGAEILGAAPRISDCCLAVSRPLIMRVEVTDTNAVSATSEVGIVGGDRCEDFSGDLCP